MKNAFGIKVTRHETRLLIGGALLAFALKSKTVKGRIIFGVLGTLFTLGDTVTIKDEVSKRWIDAAAVKGQQWADKLEAKFFPNAPQPEWHDE